MIYMDNAATTYPKPSQVAEAVNRQIQCYPGNARRGSHQAALEAGEVLTEARKNIARLFHIAQPERIAFTMNITQALNMALLGFLRPGDHVISTDMEHNALARPLALLEKQGIQWSRISAAHGIDTEQLRKEIRPNTRMVCMIHASNVTGDILPVAQIGKICKEYQITFLVDTAQSAGILTLDAEKDFIDILAFTGHKGLLGPQGTGGLYVRPGLVVRPVLTGGTGSFSESLEQPWFLPDALESGTLNAPGIAGLNSSIKFILETGIDTILDRERKHLQILWEGLREISGVKLYGSGNIENMVPAVSFSLPGVNSLEIGRYLEQKKQILCRCGMHCAGLAHQALGSFQSGTCRLSPGYFTKEDELEQVIQTVGQAARFFK